MAVKHIFTYVVLLLLCTGALAQRKVVDQTAEFNTFNQGMWGPGNAPGINNTFEIFPEYSIRLPFDTRDFTILTIEGLKFGAGIDGFFEFGIGPFQFVIEGFELGSVDVNYPSTVSIDVPQDGSFNAGETINILSDFNANPGARIVTRYPSAENARIALELGLLFDADIGFTACLAGCLPRLSVFDVFNVIGTRPQPLLDQDFKFFEITLDEITYICDAFDPLAPEDAFQCTVPGVGNPPSYSFTDSKNIFTADAELPFVQTTSQIVGNRVLVATGEHAYVNNSVNVISLIALIPVVKPFAQVIEGSVDLLTVKDFVGNDVSVTVSWALVRIALEVPITHKQRFVFEPEIVTTLEFPDTVTYVVKSQTKGDISGRGPTLEYQIGDEVNVDFPCEYEFMDVTATHRIINDFSNKTNDNIKLQLTVEALDFGLHVDPFIIIPRICIPIPFADDLCVGPVGTPPLDIDPDPLWTPDPIVLIDQDFPPYIDRTWELANFNDVEAPLFRLEPREAQVNFATTDVVCFGESTATITTDFPNATEPVQYEWSFGSTSKSPVNVPGGKHEVKITDARECILFESVTIGQPEELTAEISATDISCTGATEADINLVVEGGTGPYTFLWNTSATSPGLVDQVAGTYSVTITDDNGCSIERSITIEQPTDLVVRIFNPVEPSCAGASDGSLDLFVDGGTPPYSFLWSNGQIGQSIDELPAGNYSVEVTDVNRCTLVDNITLSQPAALQAAVSTTADVSCFSEANGGLTVLAQGGTPPYEYTWYNKDITLGAKSTSIDNLASGFYSVEVLDSKGCRIVIDRVVNQPLAPLQASMIPTHVTCSGNNDGAIDLIVEGGTPPYRYLWSNGATAEDVSNLAEGAYEVLVTDDNDCTVGTKTLVITPREIVPSLIISDVSCQDQEDASIEIRAIRGGFEPYTVQWSTGSTDMMIEALAEGSYGVTITDDEGCVFQETIDITKNDITCLFIPNSFSPNGDDINDTWKIRNIELYPSVQLRVFNRWGVNVFENTGYERPWDGMFQGRQLEPGTYYYIIDLKDGSPLYTGPLSILQ